MFASDSANSAVPHYAVAGFLRGDFGLAIAGRNTVRVLSGSGRAVDEIVVEPPANGPSHRTWQPTDPGPRTANIFHMNPVEVAATSTQWYAAVDPKAPNVCVPVWELPLVPRRWEPILQAMDAVLAPTHFIQSACARVLPPDRVLHYPQAAFIPPPSQPSRASWGLSERATVFIVSFDPGSDVDRKNPFAAIDAFQRAFESVDDVHLVVKTRPWTGVPHLVAAADALRNRVRGDRRVRVIERSLSYGETLGLYASCDVMLSLHRSEGLGLHLMEAMSLGKVVVATNWSGNTDYMDDHNSVPVPYSLVPVATKRLPYALEVGREGQVWADADVDAAARALRELHSDPGRRRVLGDAARRTMEERHRAALQGATFASLEALLRAGAATPRLDRAIRRTRRRLLLDWVFDTLRTYVGAAPRPH